MFSLIKSYRMSLISAGSISLDSTFKYIQERKKIWAKRTRLIPEIGKIEVKKKNWIEVKRTEAVFLNFCGAQELIPPSYALTGWRPYL